MRQAMGIGVRLGMAYVATGLLLKAMVASPGCCSPATAAAGVGSEGPGLRRG